MKKLALWIAAATLMTAQTPPSEKKAEFEVASIRPAKDDGSRHFDGDKGFLRTHNLTLKRLIASAWEIDEGQIFGGPAWIASDGWDINARIPAEFAQQAREKRPQMIQSLLADRFQLVIHREPREISGYALVVAKKGAKMERAKADQKDSNSNSNNTHLKAENVTMEALARELSRNRDIGKLVVDKTGLTGGYNFELDWVPQGVESTPDDHSSIFTSLQEQLGLKLESAKITTLAIVVDRAAKPDEN